MKTTIVLAWIMAGIVLGGCAGVPRVPSDSEALHFEDVASHLDLGGEYYMYIDLDGDLKTGAALLNELVAQTDGLSDEEKERFDAVEIARLLGLTGINAMGSSSYRINDRYINKEFVKITPERTGLLKMSGGPPHEFDVVSIAPRNAFAAIEQDLNLKAFVEVLMAVTRRLFPDTMAKIDEDLHEPLSRGFPSVMDIVEHADTRIVAFLSANQAHSISIPGTDVVFPQIDVVFAIDNMGFLMDAIEAEIAEVPVFDITRNDRWHTIVLTESLPGDFSVYQPVLRRDMKTDRLYLSTNLAYLNASLEAGQDKLGDNPKFASLMDEMPFASGNALLYVSQASSEVMRPLAELVAVLDEDLKELSSLIDFVMENHIGDHLGVVANRNNGIWSVSSSVTSVKWQLFSYMGVLPAWWGIGAAIMVPGLTRYFETNSDSATCEAPLPYEEAPLEVPGDDL